MHKLSIMFFLNIAVVSLSSFGMDGGHSLCKAPVNTVKKLFKAIKNNKLVQVQKIIQNSPKIIDAFDSYADVTEKISALHVAAADGYSASVELLLQSGANPNVLTINQHSPLHYARSAQAVELLVKAGAKVDQENCIGQTPLFYSLIKPPCRKLHNNYCMSYSVAKALVEAGANITHQDYAGSSLLQEVVKHERVRSIAFLLFHGEGCQQWNNDQVSVVDFVIQLNQPLLFNRYNAQAAQHLMIESIKNKDTDSLKILLANGIDYCVERYECDGNWLHYAVDHDNPRAIEHMIEFGVNFFCCDGKGRTAVECAIAGKKFACVAAFNKALCKYLSHAFYNSTYERWQKIIEHIIDINMPITGDQRTLLHEVCRIGTHKHVSLVIAAGADVTRADVHGYTPLECYLNRCMNS